MQRGRIIFFCAVEAEFGHQYRRHLQGVDALVIHGVDTLVMFIRSL